IKTAQIAAAQSLILTLLHGDDRAGLERLEDVKDDAERLDVIGAGGGGGAAARHRLVEFVAQVRLRRVRQRDRCNGARLAIQRVEADGVIFEGNNATLAVEAPVAVPRGFAPGGTP